MSLLSYIFEMQPLVCLLQEIKGRRSVYLASR